MTHLSLQLPHQSISPDTHHVNILPPPSLPTPISNDMHSKLKNDPIECLKFQKKLPYFQYVVYSKSPDIFAITPTWFSSSISDYETIHLGYKIHFRDGSPLVGVS